MSVKEIAYRLGYCNQFYFSEEFKRITGRTPTEYRRYQKTLPREE
ncbi:MAG: helix-turn-helix domain-containing protein [Victivallis vadensis]